MTDDGIHRNEIQEEAVTFDAPESFIVVSKGGDDEFGNGSFESPLLTIAKALASATADRNTIYVLAGEYVEAALVWPSITGISLVALGPVTIANSDAATAVLTIAPTWTASTFEATIRGIAIDPDAQIALKIANAAMTRKLNVYIDGLECGYHTSGDSIDVAGTVSGQAIRVYARDLSLSGLLHFTANDAGSRLRIVDSDLVGGLTCAGAVAAECTLRNVQMLTSGITVATEWTLCNVGCLYATNADPCVHSEFVDVYAG